MNLRFLPQLPHALKLSASPAFCSCLPWCASEAFIRSASWPAVPLALAPSRPPLLSSWFLAGRLWTRVLQPGKNWPYAEHGLYAATTTPWLGDANTIALSSGTSLRISPSRSLPEALVAEGAATFIHGYGATRGPWSASVWTMRGASFGTPLR